MSRRTLLFARFPEDLATIGRALRDAGYVVFPARYHENAIDGMARVAPDLVLFDYAHHGTIVTPRFQQYARESGAQVLIFMPSDGREDAATLQRVQRLPYPVLEYTGDGRTLAELVSEVFAGSA